METRASKRVKSSLKNDSTASSPSTPVRKRTVSLQIADLLPHLFPTPPRSSKNDEAVDSYVRADSDDSDAPATATSGDFGLATPPATVKKGHRSSIVAAPVTLSKSTSKTAKTPTKDETSAAITDKVTANKKKPNVEDRSVLQRKRRAEKKEQFKAQYAYHGRYNTRGRKKFLTVNKLVKTFNQHVQSLPHEIQDLVLEFIILGEVEEMSTPTLRVGTGVVVAPPVQPGVRATAPVQAPAPEMPQIFDVLSPLPDMCDRVRALYYKLGYELYVDFDSWSKVRTLPESVRQFVKKIRAVLVLTPATWKNEYKHCIRFVMGMQDHPYWPNVTEHEVDLTIPSWHGDPARPFKRLDDLFSFNENAFTGLKLLKLTTHKDDRVCQLCWNFHVKCVRNRTLQTGVEAELFEHGSDGRNTWVWQAPKGKTLKPKY